MIFSRTINRFCVGFSFGILKRYRFIGPRPGAPRNVTVQEVDNGFVISWEAPQERPDLVKYYTIMYRIDTQWKDLTRASKIRSDETKFLGNATNRLVFGLILQNEGGCGGGQW